MPIKIPFPNQVLEYIYYTLLYILIKLYSLMNIHDLNQMPASHHRNFNYGARAYFIFH